LKKLEIIIFLTSTNLLHRCKIMFVLALNVFTIHAVLAETVPAVALPADVADAPAHAPPARRLYSGLCRRERVMGCKQGCKRGWKHIKTIGWGCCKSWSSCGGNQKVCEQYYNCRRRNEDEESDNTTEDNNKFIGMMEDEFGDEIDAVTSSEQASPVQNGVADGVFEAVEPEVISTAEENDTKHFVMEDGEWVQLSQVEAKGMTAIVSEEADVELSDSLSEDTEDARRRWSGFPGWPSWLQRCRDEMEMPCNMPCLGGWSLFVEIENGCCMNGPGGIDHPKPCGFTTKVCQKFYLCHRSG